MITRDILHPALIIENEERSYTYDDFILLLNKWHSYFDKLGLKKGDLYVTDTEFSVEQVALLIAAAERGLVFYAISLEQWSDKRNRSEWIRSGVRVIFATLTDAPRAIDIIPYACMEKVHEFEPIVPNITVQPNDVAVIGVTSGTTGKPKKFTHTHRTLAVTTLYNAKKLFKSSDLVFSFLSINHSAVITQNVIPSLVAGSKHFYHKLSSGDLLGAILKHRPNKVPILFTTIAYSLQIDPKWDTCKLDFIEEVLTGGEVLRYDEVAKTLLVDKGVQKLLNTYGSSETGTIFGTTLTKENLEASFSKEGYPLIEEIYEHVELKLKDGNLHVKSPGMAIDAPLAGGWFSTRDRAIEVDNKIYMVGRELRTVRINDRIVSLESIDYRLKQYTKNGITPIKRSYTFEREQKLYAIVDTYTDVDLSIEELNAYVSKYWRGLVGLSGFVIGQPTFKEGSLKSVWDTDVTIPEENLLT